MRVVLDIRKTVDQNAAIYFEKSKKAKKKVKGATKALEKSKANYEKEKKRVDAIQVEDTTPEKIVKREWFEKFRWCWSSDGFLMIGGRDATTNEIIIKKYADEGDLVFHTDMAGSPFIVIKANGKKIPKKTLQEAAEFEAAYSRAWKRGMASIEVFHVNPDQVTKDAPSGEYLTKGAFIIKGKTTYLSAEMNFAVGVYKKMIMGGPLLAIKKHCKEFIEIVQGDEKSSDIGKKIRAKLGGNLDDIIRILPPGSSVKKERKK